MPRTRGKEGGEVSSSSSFLFLPPMSSLSLEKPLTSALSKSEASLIHSNSYPSALTELARDRTFYEGKGKEGGESSQLGFR